MNNYDIKLLKEREDKYTIIYGDLSLSEEFLVEAYNKLVKQKSIDYEVEILKFTKDICNDIKNKYPDLLLKIQRYEDDWDSYEGENISYFINYDMHYLGDINKNFIGELECKYYESNNYIASICFCYDIMREEGEFYEI